MGKGSARRPGEITEDRWNAIFKKPMPTEPAAEPEPSAEDGQRQEKSDKSKEQEP